MEGAWERVRLKLLSSGTQSDACLLGVNSSFTSAAGGAGIPEKGYCAKAHFLVSINIWHLRVSPSYSPVSCDSAKFV